MNNLFEEFVARWIAKLLNKSEYRATPQRRDRTILWDADSDRPYTSVIPDVVVEKKGVSRNLFPIDAKYKLYDDRKVSTADIYQSFMYAFAYGQSSDRLSHGMIIYPTSAIKVSSQRLHVRPLGAGPKAELAVIGINVPLALEEAVNGKCGTFGSVVLAVFGRGCPLYL